MSGPWVRVQQGVHVVAAKAQHHEEENGDKNSPGRETAVTCAGIVAEETPVLPAPCREEG